MKMARQGVAALELIIAGLVARLAIIHG